MFICLSFDALCRGYTLPLAVSSTWVFAHAHTTKTSRTDWVLSHVVRLSCRILQLVLSHSHDKHCTIMFFVFFVVFFFFIFSKMCSSIICSFLRWGRRYFPVIRIVHSRNPSADIFVFLIRFLFLFRYRSSVAFTMFLVNLSNCELLSKYKLNTINTLHTQIFALIFKRNFYWAHIWKFSIHSFRHGSKAEHQSRTLET